MNKDKLIFSNCSSIAILGGTFNPIHNGHLLVAQEVYDNYKPDKIIFMPTGNSYHKEEIEITPYDRYLMCMLAIENNKNFEVSTVDIDRKGLTYTIDTLKSIDDICKIKLKIYFIVGFDALEDIESWYKIKEIFSLCTIIVVNRGKSSKEKIIKKINTLKERYDSNIELLDIPTIEISSSNIRNRIDDNKSIKYLVPSNVENYIIKNKLYKPMYHIEFIEQTVKDKLSEKRYMHTLSVAKEATQLAKLHNVNPDDAYLAGLLHDYAKEQPLNEKLKLCEKYNIDLESDFNNYPELAHGLISSKLVQLHFNISNEDILNAIANHTIGRPNMSKLEKVIFITDMIEPFRFGKNKELDRELQEIKDAIYKSLDYAMYLALKSKIDFTKTKNKFVHPSALEALEYYKLFNGRK